MENNALSILYYSDFSLSLSSWAFELYLMFLWVYVYKSNKKYCMMGTYLLLGCYIINNLDRPGSTTPLFRSNSPLSEVRTSAPYSQHKANRLESSQKSILQIIYHCTESSKNNKIYYLEYSYCLNIVGLLC